MMKRNYFMKSLIFTSFVIAIVFTNVSLSTKVIAETGQGKDVFKVIVTLYGITNSTKDIVTIINVGDQTKVKLYSPDNPTTEGSDKVSYTFAFPNMAVQDGQKFTVCNMS